MNQHEHKASTELRAWQKEMLKKPSMLNKLSKSLQTKINNWIPEKVHKAVTVAIKQMIRTVVFGAKLTTAKPLIDAPFKTREELVIRKIDVFRKTAAIEGGVTGAGGILLGLADF